MKARWKIRHSLLSLVARPTAAVARVTARVVRRFKPIDRWASRGTALGISFYQRSLSPVKGFRCAHAVATGGPSCSDVALDAFRHYRFSEALSLAEGQFASCRTAYLDGLPDAVDAALRGLPNVPGTSGLVCGGDSDCCPCGGGPIPP